MKLVPLALWVVLLGEDAECQEGKVVFCRARRISINYTANIGILHSYMASSCEWIKWKRLLEGLRGFPRDLEATTPEVFKLLRPWVGCRGWDLQTGLLNLKTGNIRKLSLHFFIFFHMFLQVVTPNALQWSTPSPTWPGWPVMWSDFKIGGFQIPKGKQLASQVVLS